MFVQKCGLLLMHRIQANLDEKAVVFLPRISFFYPFAWAKKLVFFYYNFSLGKDNKKISMSQYTLAWGLPSIKRPRKYLSLF